MRLQRVMADAGIASRRDCERLIEEGHVSVNGRTVTRLPVFVDPAADEIRIDGRPLQRVGRHIYVLLYKPARTLATTRDDPTLAVHRTTILDLIDHPEKPRLFPVGRLGFHASGLVLLTSDGDLAHRLTHPRFAIPRTYELLVKRTLSQADLDQMERAFLGGPARRRPPVPPLPPADAPVRLRLLKHDDDRSLVELTLLEGPNRTIADVLARLGCPVKKVRRVAIGPLRLRGVALGAWRELHKSEVAQLQRAARDPAGAGAPARRRRAPLHARLPGAQESA